jgi:antitoxin VapB
MATMNIKDPEVHRLAHALARQRGVSATRAVRQALEETLAGERVRREGMAARLVALSRRSLAVDEPVMTDQDLYDGQGLPR